MLCVLCVGVVCRGEDVVLELNIYNGFTGQEVKYTVRSGKERVLIVSVCVVVVGVRVSVAV